MKANNLTISIPAACTKDCPYCISKMTFSPDINGGMFDTNLPKASHMAERAQINSVLITSKGEPTNNWRALIKVIKEFSIFPVELQTNGAHFVNNPQHLSTLASYGLDILALSIDKMEDFDKLQDVLLQAENISLTVRITVVLSKRFSEVSFNDILRKCQEYGVRQLTLRRVSIPTKMISTDDSINTRDWILDNDTDVDHIEESLTKKALKSNKIRTLPFDGGTVGVSDIGGVGVTKIDYCIQEANSGDDIRSLIYHQDGHMYTSWDKPGSILF